MEAAEVAGGQPTRVLASDREVTRLGESVFRNGAVSEEAIKATCAVLVRMAALYRKLAVVGVRAVATSAIRDTRNQREFLERASEAAGTHVEIISGREEARLIHLGVESVWPQGERRVLICDIGGGSAEIVASQDGGLHTGFSKPLGAVRLREIFLKDDLTQPHGVFETAGGRAAARDLPQGRSAIAAPTAPDRSEEHTSELQSLRHLVCRLLL